jgi:geranylgeranyl diphosphate synthase type I
MTNRVDKLILEMQTCLDQEISDTISRNLPAELSILKQMLYYPLGLDTKLTRVVQQGKQIRPLILLLTCHSLGGNWKSALPAAAAIEILHNFSLVHDDIQDESLSRRGRESAWVRYGRAQAINIGDALIFLGDSAIRRLSTDFPESVVLQAMKMLHTASLLLTEGQFLDLHFEKEDDISLEQYWRMIEGKTGALLGCAFGLGAYLAGRERSSFVQLGIKYGRAFQVQDDWLGLWGNPELTGKSIHSDLMERKKTYPAIYSMTGSDEFRKKWLKTGSLSNQDIDQLHEYMTDLNVAELTQKAYLSEYKEADQLFTLLFPDEDKTEQLKDFLAGLFNRAT